MAGITDVERYISLKFTETRREGRVSVPTAGMGGIKLNANENPYGCSPKVMKALADYHDLNYYPDVQQIRKLLAGYAGVGEEYIVPSSGGSEILDLVAHLFVGSGDEVIFCPPTFGLFTMRAQLYGGVLVSVPRDTDFAVNVPAVKAAITAKTKVIVLVNPNNPTGTLTPLEDILQILDTGLPVLLDEAYAEFSGLTLKSYVGQYQNLMLVRTLSKWAGLAGVRVGFGIFPPKIAEYIGRITLPFHVNRVAYVATQESLKDLDYLMGNVNRIIEERERLIAELGKMKFLKPYASRGNYVCCSVLSGDAPEIQREMAARGIQINAVDVGKGGMNAIRITVGKPEHTDAVLKVLRDYAVAKGLPA